MVTVTPDREGGGLVGLVTLWPGSLCFLNSRSPTCCQSFIQCDQVPLKASLTFKAKFHLIFLRYGQKYITLKMQFLKIKSKAKESKAYVQPT